MRLNSGSGGGAGRAPVKVRVSQLWTRPAAAPAPLPLQVRRDRTQHEDEPSRPHRRPDVQRLAHGPGRPAAQLALTSQSRRRSAQSNSDAQTPTPTNTISHPGPGSGTSASRPRDTRADHRDPAHGRSVFSVGFARILRRHSSVVAPAVASSGLLGPAHGSMPSSSPLREHRCGG